MAADCANSYIEHSHLPLRECLASRRSLYRRLPRAAGYRAFLHRGYVDAVKIRPRQTANQAAAQAFLARHNSVHSRGPDFVGGGVVEQFGGHHPPLLHHGGGLRPLTGTAAALPLGLEDDFTAFTASWLPGDRLLLYTDGLVESRNHHGDFLPEDQIATALLAADCDQALDTLITAVHRHTGGHGHDDVALLLLEYGAHPHNSATGHPRPGRCQDASVAAEVPDLRDQRGVRGGM